MAKRLSQLRFEVNIIYFGRSWIAFSPGFDDDDTNGMVLSFPIFFSESHVVIVLFFLDYQIAGNQDGLRRN